MFQFISHYKILTTLIAAPLTILIFFKIFLFLPPQNIFNTTRSGIHLRSEIWGGTIHITGDTYFAPWAPLTIEPGTKILFEKNPNAPNTPWTKYADDFITKHNDPTGHTGYNKSHFEIYGRILAIGTAVQPIIFTSAQAKPEYADWDELVLASGSKLDHVEVSYAHNGINVQGNNVSVTNSRVHDSLWSCIDIFSSGNRIDHNEVYHCWHQAIGLKAGNDNIVTNNFLHDAQLSINCEQGAKPTIENNHFEAAPLNPDCGPGTNNTKVDRRPDIAGGTYDGSLIYPSQE
ncbi:MAG: right-handed parallel beta-helix repeat-containing protein [Candidatus Magasanikbacteria bacterium]|nr:right-handed parallel beta-helix repeat-containing protein [Candidatus Magasanikbacteria bacterium]